MKRNHIIICHCPSPERILQLVAELRASKKNNGSDIVLVTEAFDELPEALAKVDIGFVHGNPLREEILEKAGARHAEGVIIFAKDPADPDSDARSYAIGTVVEWMEKEEGRSIKVVMEVVSAQGSKLAERAGVDGYHQLESFSDNLLAQEYIHPGARTVYNQLLTNLSGSQIYLQENHLPQRPLRDYQVAFLQHPSSVQLLGCLRDGHALFSPDAKTMLEETDALIFLAEEEHDFVNLQKDVSENLKHN